MYRRTVAGFSGACVTQPSPTLKKKPQGWPCSYGMVQPTVCRYACMSAVLTVIIDEAFYHPAFSLPVNVISEGNTLCCVQSKPFKFQRMFAFSCPNSYSGCRLEYTHCTVYIALKICVTVIYDFTSSSVPRDYATT